MRARFVLLGTNHPLQFGAPDCPKEKIDAYHEFLLAICRPERIKLIAEEASTDGFERYSVNETVGALVAKGAGLAHKMVDLPYEERVPLGILDGQLSRITFAVKNEGECDLGPLRQSLNKLSDQVREGTWIARTLLESTWPVLLIVGANHVQAVENLIRSIQQEVVIAHADYEP